MTREKDTLERPAALGAVINTRQERVLLKGPFRAEQRSIPVDQDFLRGIDTDLQAGRKTGTGTGAGTT